MIRLISIIKEILAEQTAAGQAKAMGLVSIGFGRWYDPRLKKITHVTRDDKLEPYQGKSTPNQPRKEPSDRSRITRSREELMQLAHEMDADWIHPSEKWNDPSNTTYGPAPENAPDIVREVEMGNYEDTPIRGIVQDLDESQVDKLMPDIRKRQSPSYATEIMDSVYKKLTTDETDISDIAYHMGEWQNGWVENKKTFIDNVGNAFPTRVNTNGPIMRGLRVSSVLLDEFMDDFEIGSTITFPESYSFTTDLTVAKNFSGIENPTEPVSIEGTEYQLDYTVFIRMHPSEDGLTSGVYIPGVHDAYESALKKLEEDGELSSKQEEVKSSLVPELYKELEFLSLPNTEYQVLGRAKIKQSNGAMAMIIDIKEKASQTTEQGLPARPTLPKPKAKSVNKVVHQYMDGPLNPNK